LNHSKQWVTREAVGRQRSEPQNERMDFFTCSAASQGWVSALGHKRIRTAIGHVRFTPKADILQPANIEHRKVIRSPCGRHEKFVTGDVG
jgi:hypothetical protein